MNIIKLFFNKHKEYSILLGLGIIFYFIFIHGIGSYALMDVDETRYVSMAKDMFLKKDFLTLYLNNEYFFEKPPLYFWLESLSFAFFRTINEFTARLPIALLGVISCFMTYFLGKKFVSTKYGVISALVLATSLEFLILAKFAILDIVLACCVWLSLSFGLLFLFEENNDKLKFLYSTVFYISCGLAVMAKGIPGFVIPLGSIFLISIYLKCIKKFFQPNFFVTGIVLFLLIVLPWHILMLKLHNPLFYDEYIIKHHVARFLGEGGINRNQPFYFYFITLIWGLFPWCLSIMFILIHKLKQKTLDLAKQTKSQKFLSANLIIVIFSLLFFSISKTKLITYILPIYPSIACLVGYFWYRYVIEKKYEKVINISVYILSGVLITASTLAIFCRLYLPEQIYSDISEAKTFCITLLFATGLASILFAKKRIYWGVFFSYVFLMLSLSAFGTPQFFKIDYKFGQNDLIRFAQYAKENDKKITTYKFGYKYSLIYYGKYPVEYGIFYNLQELKKAINKNDNVVIIPKKFIDYDVERLNYKILDKGRKYILVE